jgi:16S rRNA (cytosine967-C5)-methyltransferase
VTAAGLPARRLALTVLADVLQHRLALDAALEQRLAAASLELRDRAFARRLIATVLRRLGQIDDLIDGALDRPLPRRAAAVRHALRLGIAQILFLAAPPHAAVATSVALIADIDGGKFKGVVNALLRRMVRDGAALAAGQDAARLVMPGWLWMALVGAYGEETTRAIAAAHLVEPPLDLSVAADPEGWAVRLDAVILPTGTLRRAAGGSVADLPGYAEGAWWVQDAAAAFPVRLMGEIRGRRVLDLCAAPGGKTAQLAAAGAVVTAVDRSAPRLARLADNLRRLGLAARLVEADATTLPADGAPFHAVLVDAPCSATGTLRRHPDVAWLKTPSDVAGLMAVQERVLARAAELVCPGGLLVWCVCSLLPEESESRIAAFLGADSRFRRDPVGAAEIGGLAEAVTPEGEVRTLPSHWPEKGGIDGFHIARLRRQS